jgi:hypothetical protein
MLSSFEDTATRQASRSMGKRRLLMSMWSAGRSIQASGESCLGRWTGAVLFGSVGGT